MKAIALTTLFSLALTGCSDSAMPTPDAAPVARDANIAPVAEAAHALPLAHGRVVELPVGDKEQQLALPLFGDQSVGITVTNSAADELVGVGVLVGNYGGTSRGDVELKVCVATECRESILDTASSIDNEVLTFPVEPALPMQAGAELKLTMTRQTGGNEFAIWTFPIVDEAARVESDDPAFQNRTARIQLLLK